jgi:predicted dehydrogenase
MRKLKIGCIGAGYWGPNLIRNFVENSHAQVVAISDLDQERLDHIQTRYPNIKYATRNYQDLFDMDLDGIVISTPPHTHYKIGKDCLEKGHHIFIEKPLTLKSSDAVDLINIAESYNRVLMVGHTFEYNPAVHALKDMITKGELGEIHYIDAVRVSLGLFQTRLNVIWDLAPHDISIMHYLLDKTPTHVSAQGLGCIQPNVEDVAYVNLYFEDNILAHIRSSWLDPHKKRQITVVGSEKMAVYDDVAVQGKIQIYDKRVKAIRRTDTFGDFQFAYHYGDVVSPYINMEEPLRRETAHFLECIREQKTPQTDGYNGLRVVQVIEAAQDSLKNGGVNVPVKFDDVFSEDGKGAGLQQDEIKGKNGKHAINQNLLNGVMDQFLSKFNEGKN